MCAASPLRFPKPMSASRIARLFVLLLAVHCAACSDAQSPTAPSSPDTAPSVPAPLPPAPAGDPSAQGLLIVENASVIRELMANNTDVYRVEFDLVERGGSAAMVKAIDLSFSNGLSRTFGAEVVSLAQVPAGGSARVSGIAVPGDANARAVSVQIRVLVTDVRGRDSTSLAAEGITPAYVVIGRVRDAATGRAVPGATVLVTFGRATGRHATTDVAGGFELRTIPRGTVGLVASAPGYDSVTKTADLDSNTTIDFSLTQRP
jgi:hypothetical protein